MFDVEGNDFEDFSLKRIFRSGDFLAHVGSPIRFSKVVFVGKFYLKSTSDSKYVVESDGQIQLGDSVGELEMEVHVSSR
eukprot:276327-Karenia_brevis.AAC.1